MRERNLSVGERKDCDEQRRIYLSMEAVILEQVIAHSQVTPKCVERERENYEECKNCSVS